MRFHDRRHRADPEPPDKKSALVEIEAALMQGHRVERSALHHDELRGLIIEPAQGPAHLILVVAVDEDELLANGHEIERIPPLARAGDPIALVIEIVLLHAHSRIEDLSTIEHSTATNGNGVGTP